MHENTAGRYPYWEATIEYRAPVNRLELAVPNALMEIRIGKARTTGPSTTSPHVYAVMNNKIFLGLFTYHSNSIWTKQGCLIHYSEIWDISKEIKNDNWW